MKEELPSKSGNNEWRMEGEQDKETQQAERGKEGGRERETAASGENAFLALPASRISKLCA